MVGKIKTQNSKFKWRKLQHSEKKTQKRKFRWQKVANYQKKVTNLGEKMTKGHKLIKESDKLV